MVISTGKGNKQVREKASYDWLVIEPTQSCDG